MWPTLVENSGNVSNQLATCYIGKRFRQTCVKSDTERERERTRRIAISL